MYEYTGHDSSGEKLKLAMRALSSVEFIDKL